MNAFRRAIARWGKEKQIDMLQEECGEVIAALNRYKRGRISEAELATELADLKIMLSQAWEIFDRQALELAYDFKVLRLIDKLNTLDNESQRNGGEPCPGC